MPRLAKLMSWFQTRSIAGTGLLLFVACGSVYLLNGDIFSSNDNIPHTLLAFNWLENGTLHFDNFRGQYFKVGNCPICVDQLPYFFAEADNGHLTSTYPIGSAIVTFPLYVLFFLYLKALHWTQSGGAAVLDITTRAFEQQREGFEKLSAAIATALTVAILYWSLRLKFSSKTAVWTAIVYAFATSAWTLNSQGLRQHTVGNLLVMSLVLCLWKADRCGGGRRRALLLAGGVLCGLLPGVRLTSALFSVAAAVFAVFAYRKAALFFLLGMSSALLSIGWNLYYFGNLTGGYSKLLAGNAGSYVFEPGHFIQAFLGLLISPNFGILIFSPLVLFAVPGIRRIWQQRDRRDEQLLLCFTAAAIALFLNYCCFQPWTGGGAAYGSRYMTDLLPVLGIAIAYFLAAWGDRPMPANPRSGISPALAVFICCALLTGAIQVLGVSTKTNWGSVPVPLMSDLGRVWRLSDTRIQRHLHRLYHDFTHPIADPESYLAGLQGTVEQVANRDRQPFTDLIRLPARSEVVLRAVVKNTGRSRWYGYQTGMQRGGTRVRVRFFRDQQEIKPALNALYVSGQPPTGQTAEAIGRITFPAQPGRYRVVFDLVSEGVGDFPNSPPLELTAQLKRRDRQPPA